MSFSVLPSSLLNSPEIFEDLPSPPSKRLKTFPEKIRKIDINEYLQHYSSHVTSNKYLSLQSCFSPLAFRFADSNNNSSSPQDESSQNFLSEKTAYIINFVFQFKMGQYKFAEITASELSKEKETLFFLILFLTKVKLEKFDEALFLGKKLLEIFDKTILIVNFSNCTRAPSFIIDADVLIELSLDDYEKIAKKSFRLVEMIFLIYFYCGKHSETEKILDWFVVKEFKKPAFLLLGSISKVHQGKLTEARIYWNNIPVENIYQLSWIHRIQLYTLRYYIYGTEAYKNKKFIDFCDDPSLLTRLFFCMGLNEARLNNFAGAEELIRLYPKYQKEENQKKILFLIEENIKAGDKIAASCLMTLFEKLFPFYTLALDL